MGAFLKRNTLQLFFGVALIVPLLDFVLPSELRFGDQVRPIFIWAILALGLNVITGFTGMLHLGVAGLMAVGAYVYAIFTCDIYPFQLGCFTALLLAMVLGAATGVVLGFPTMRLMGDYLAIVTLGFGEIIQNVFRNLDTITKGTQGINPLPPPAFPFYVFDPMVYQPWYYLFLFILFLVVVLTHNLEHSRLGRSWIAIREDELASKCMGIGTARSKLVALAIGSALASLAGGLWACNFGSSGEPSNYDFQISILALCIVIVGGMGNIGGVLLGAVIMIGFNSIVLVRASEWMMRQGFVSTSNVMASPANWKYMIFGFALILMMRYRPGGVLPSRGGLGR